MQSWDASQTSSCCFFDLTWLHSQKLLGFEEWEYRTTPGNLVTNTIDKKGNTVSFWQSLARRYIEYRRTQKVLDYCRKWIVLCVFFFSGRTYLQHREKRIMIIVTLMNYRTPRMLVWYLCWELFFHCAPTKIRPLLSHYSQVLAAEVPVFSLVSFLFIHTQQKLEGS